MVMPNDDNAMTSIPSASAEYDPFLTDHIPLDIIPAVLRLADHSSDVLELCREDPRELEAYFQVARIYRKHAIKNRQSTDTLSTSRSSAISSVFSNQPDSRASLVSNVTDLSRTSSVSSTAALRPTQHGTLRTSLPLHIHDLSVSASSTAQPRPRNLLTKEKRYKCHVCVGRGANRPSDFLKHMKGFCEKPEKRFRCLDCDVIEKEDADIQSHGVIYQHRYQSDFELPPKVAFGCPFCGSLQPTLDAYARCICKDQDADPTVRAVPLLRLRGLLQQDDVKEALALQCGRRGLDQNAWKSLIWDDANIVDFAERLEYGCNGGDAYRGLGIIDVDVFVDKLLDSARFEGSNRPVPPIKDFVEAQTRELLLDDRNGTTTVNIATDDHPFLEFQSHISDYLRLRSSDPSLSETRRGVQELTATALQHDTDADFYPPWKQLHQKRPPSTSSSSMKDSRSRSKRPAQVNSANANEPLDTPAPLLADGNHFLFELDPALSRMREVLSSRKPARAAIQSDSEPAVQVIETQQPLSDDIFSDDDFNNFLHDDFYDSYGLEGMV